MNAVFLNIAAYDNKTETLGNCIFIGWSTASLIAQTFTEQKNTYPLSADGSKYVVNGFIPFSPMNDEVFMLMLCCGLLKTFALHSVTE